MLKELVLVVFGYVLGKSKSTKGAILDSIGAFFILGLVMYVALAILIAVKFMLGLVLFPFRLLLGMLRRE